MRGTECEENKEEVSTFIKALDKDGGCTIRESKSLEQSKDKERGHRHSEKKKSRDTRTAVQQSG